MRTLAIRWRKYSLFVLAFSLWMWWDLSQAHNHLSSVYQSFFPQVERAAGAPTATKVALVRSDDVALANPTPIADAGITAATIEQMVRRAIVLSGGLRGIVKSGDKVLIKPNIVQQDSSGSGGVTDVRVVRAVVKIVDEVDHGKIHIVVGDGSPRPYTSYEKASGTKNAAWVQLFDVPGYQLLKNEMLAEGVDFRLSNLNGNSDTNPLSELLLVDVPGGGNAQPQGGKYYIHQDVVNADVYITVPVMKIHDPGMTVALKNQIGLAASSVYGMPKTSGVAQDGYKHKLLHLAEAPYNWTDKEIVDLCLLARIKFSVVDAVACLETQKTPSPVGVSNSKVTNLVRMNTIVAGVDPVAVDHVCARLMGLNPDDIEHVTLAERQGIGTNNPDSISIVGGSLESTMRRFKKNQQPGAIYGQSNRDWLLRGPFSIGSISDPMNNEFISNEAAVSPVPGEGGWSQSFYFINDRINLNDYYKPGSSDQIVSYAFAYFKVPADQEVELWVGSDEAMKVYVNGNPAYTFNGTRTFSSSMYYSETKKISVKKGLNRLLVKTLQKYGTYDFSLNLCEVETNPLYLGNRVWGLKFSTRADVASAISADVVQVPTGWVLQNCYPNPFNGSVLIRFQAPENKQSGIFVYNVLGQRIRTLFDAKTSSTQNVVRWDGTDEHGRTVASGSYIIVLNGENQQRASSKVVYLK
ncbi:MAG: DUF362 domain-containing protein [Ignavibacteriales bacterium]|nr:DUF362 domain-containing protein [Ignavibacteriales bacterium]